MIKQILNIFPTVIILPLIDSSKRDHPKLFL